MMCAPMSPRAPDPALSFCRRQARGKAGVDDPVLLVLRADVAHLAEAAVGDQLAGERQRRHPAVVEADHRADPPRRGGLGDRGHLLRLGHRVTQGLLAEHVLARLQRGDRDLGVAVAGGAHVHDVDVVARDELAPVGRPLRPAELVRGGLGGRARCDRRSPSSRLRGEVEHVRRGAPCQGVGGAHEGVADLRDPQRRDPRGGVLLGHGVAPRGSACGSGGKHRAGNRNPAAGNGTPPPNSGTWGVTSLTASACKTIN